MPKVRHDIVLRAGLAARSALAAATRKQHLDLVFFHTQMPAVFCIELMGRTPGVISIDATPTQFASLGKYYGLRKSLWNRLTAAGVRRCYRAAFRNAAHVVTFSQWAAAAAVREYGLVPEGVTAIRPGVNLRVWKPAAKAADGPIRLLFVGGEFERKGGDLLLRWMASEGAETCVLDVVTSSTVPAQHGVRVHRGYGPNDPRLIELFQSADLFILPTRADTASWVTMEAMAAGTPVLATRVGAVGEYVGDDGRAGRTIEPDSYDDLRGQLRRLLQDRENLARMGTHARQRAEAMFDASRNLRRELDLLRVVASRPRTANR